MIYNKLYVNIIVRIILIAITCFGWVLSYFVLHDILLVVNCFLLLALQVILLVYFLNRTNQMLELFFASVENDDATISFKIPKEEGSFKKLVEKMDMLRTRFNKVRIENEKQYQYFRAVVENTGNGIIICSDDGTINYINEAGRNILAVNKLKHVQEIDVYNPGCSHILLGANLGQQKLIRLHIGGELHPVSFRINGYLFSWKPIRIISFQNIQHELDAQELESWQKLIRVLTHEIMNSTGPITSSIDTIKELLTDPHTQEIRKMNDLDQETITDVLSGIDIVKDRSVGLSEFIRNFRSITQNPHLSLKKIQVSELFRHVVFLLSGELKERGISVSFSIFPQSMELIADHKLFEQVLINLIYNAADALEPESVKNIELKSFVNQYNQPVIQVIDQGKGIPPEIMDKIFVPFFTTKEKGSGIGLSISRQIIQMHGGLLTLRSSPGEGTCCEICLG